MTGQLLVVTGPPGVGKTTISAILASQADPSAHVEGDAFFSFLKNGYIPPWTPEADEQNKMVIAATTAAASAYAASGIMTVLDGVFGPWFIEQLKIEAERHGVTNLHYGILMADLDVCLGRFEGRHGADAPLDMVRKMHGEFADLGDYTDHVVLSGETAEGTAHEFAQKFAAGALAVSG